MPKRLLPLSAVSPASLMQSSPSWGLRPLTIFHGSNGLTETFTHTNLRGWALDHDGRGRVRGSTE